MTTYQYEVFVLAESRQICFYVVFYMTNQFKMCIEFYASQADGKIF